MKKVFIDNFALKIIAIILMTIDHIGVLLQMFHMESEIMLNTGIVFNYIGRLAFPLFALFAVEGALKSKNVTKYILRLALIGAPILLGQIVLELLVQFAGFNFAYRLGNIFIMLIFIVIMIRCFENKNPWIKALGILPIIVSILAFACQGYEFANANKIIVWWFPYMLRPQYDIIGIFLGLAFYLSNKLIKWHYKFMGLNPDLYENDNNYQFGKNLYMILGLVVVSFLVFALSFFIPQFIYFKSDMQIFSIFASAFILFYNGRRGYNKKWFNICCYLYYPVHLVFLYGIFLLIFYI